jgi:hypothetical protein
MPSTPKRRWYFSLRTLFVVVLVIGTFAGLAIREALRRQEEELDRQQTKQALQDAWLRNDRQPTRSQRLSQ